MNAQLASLKDIPGVFGSFLLTPDGTLAGRDMPAIYPDSAFAEIGRRLQSIAETAEPVVNGFYELLAKFSGYWLLSRRTPNGTLNVIANEHVNFPALKMATNVAVRHLTETPLTPLAATPAPAAAPEPVPAAKVAPPPTPAPAAAAPATTEQRPRRIWRGMVVN